MKKFNVGDIVYYQDQQLASLEKILDNGSANEHEKAYDSLILISNFEQENMSHYPEVDSKWERRADKVNPFFSRPERVIRFIFTKESVF
jgi:hypothetical protein